MLAIVIPVFLVISAVIIIEVIIVIADRISISLIVRVIKTGYHIHLIIEVLSLVVISLICAVIEVQGFIVQHRDIIIISLLPCCRRVCIPISAGQRRRIPHRIAHSKVSLAHILIAVHFIEIVIRHIFGSIGELRAVQDIVQDIRNLIFVFAFKLVRFVPFQFSRLFIIFIHPVRALVDRFCFCSSGCGCHSGCDVVRWCYISQFLRFGRCAIGRLSTALQHSEEFRVLAC